MTTNMNNTDSLSKGGEQITVFCYRGLEFRVIENFYSVKIKQGRRIVLRAITNPDTHAGHKARMIQGIKDGIDSGFGLNIDYSKVK